MVVDCILKTHKLSAAPCLVDDPRLRAAFGSFAKWGLNDVHTFFSVQRRHFIDSPDADNGWCVVIREIETAPQLENVVKAWAEDTEFWFGIAEQERLEESAKTREALRKLSGKKRKPK